VFRGHNNCEVSSVQEAFARPEMPPKSITRQIKIIGPNHQTTVCSFKFKALNFLKTDRPWITVYFKVLIARRQHAFLPKNFVLFKALRNRINRIRKSLRKQYYLDKVDKLENPANWWKMIKLISGLQSHEMNLFDHMTFSDENVDITLLPNVINGFLSDMTSSVEQLYFQD
jgi:hypothetical protein